MSVDNYLAAIRRILVKDRVILRESKRYYRKYLSIEYNDMWSVLSREKS